MYIGSLMFCLEKNTPFSFIYRIMPKQNGSLQFSDKFLTSVETKVLLETIIHFPLKKKFLRHFSHYYSRNMEKGIERKEFLEKGKIKERYGRELEG